MRPNSDKRSHSQSGTQRTKYATCLIGTTLFVAAVAAILLRFAAPTVRTMSLQEIEQLLQIQFPEGTRLLGSEFVYWRAPTSRMAAKLSMPADAADDFRAHLYKHNGSRELDWHLETRQPSWWTPHESVDEVRMLPIPPDKDVFFGFDNAATEEMTTIYVQYWGG